MFVHVRCRMTSMPIATIDSASSSERSAVLPPAPQVTETARGALRGGEARRWIRSRRLTMPGVVRGGKNSKVWKGALRSAMRVVRCGMAAGLSTSCEWEMRWIE
jgi:hypothetical protein